MPSAYGEPAACLIGDLVGSRLAPDRSALHHRLQAVLRRVEAEYPGLSPLRVTAGDEYQGSYASLGEALAVAFSIRLALWPDSDARHGIGWGETRLLEAPRPAAEEDGPAAGNGGDGIMDGPGWWSARAAIEEVDRLEALAGFGAVRTALRTLDEHGAATDVGLEAVNAASRCRDELMGSLSARSRVLLAGLAAGLTQAELAGREEISASAVSQRVRRDGLLVILDAQHLIERM